MTAKFLHWNISRVNLSQFLHKLTSIFNQESTSSLNITSRTPYLLKVNSTLIHSWSCIRSCILLTSILTGSFAIKKRQWYDTSYYIIVSISGRSSVCINQAVRESIPFCLVLEQGDGLLKWNTTLTFSSQWLTAQKTQKYQNSLYFNKMKNN